MYKKKKGQLSVGEIMILFMGIVVALAFIPQIFDSQNILTDKQQVIDETFDLGKALINGSVVNESYEFTITNNPTGWQATSCPLTGVTIGNSTDDFTDTTDYVFTEATGVFTMKNTDVVNGSSAETNTTLVDYSYCADGYNTNSGSRGVAGLIGLFSVFILLGFAVYYLMKSDIFNS